MFRKVSFLLFFALIVFSCQKAAVEKVPGGLSKVSNQMIQGELAGAAVLKETPADLQDMLGQTPININVNNTVKFKSADPSFHYEAIEWDVVNNAIEIDGKTERNLKFNVPAGNTENYIMIAGHRYNLLQFHFHYESEHAFNGKRGEMEVHLVHQDPDTKKLAVLGVIIYRGARSKFLGEMFEASPEAGEEPNHFEEFNPMELLPNNYNNYFTYSGSLTTPGGGVAEPPYLEGLTWMVFYGFKTISDEQFAHYKEIYEEPNSRPLQPVGDRKIYQHVGYVPGE